MDRPDPLDRPVLVLDFGSQYVQLIARRVRERHAFARIVRHDITIERVRELNPLAIILSGGPSSVYEAGAPHCDPGLFRPGRAGPGDLLRDATGLRGPGRQGRADSDPRVRPGGMPGDRPDRPAVPGGARGLDRLDEPRRPGPRRGRRVRRRSRRRRPARSRPSGTRACRFMGSSSTPRSPTRRTGRLILGNFLDRVCQSPGSWTMDAFLDRAVEAIGRAVGPTDRVVCGLSGGVDSAVCAALAGEGARPAGRLRVRRQRPAPLGRAGRRGRGVRRATPRPNSGSLTPRDRFLEALRGVTDPQEKRVRIGHTFIDVFRDEAKSIDGATLPRARDALPRRDRERRRPRRPGGDDQAPPQRRRPAQRAGLQADRAAPRPLQGRGPPARPGTRPARDRSSGATRSPAPAWPSAAWAR